MGRVADVARARDAVGREAWAEAYALLRSLDEPGLAPEDLDALADAAWWLCRVDESITARQKAYSGYAVAGADRQAGYAAWMLFYEHHLAGRAAVAAGWLGRVQRHLGGEPECRVRRGRPGVPARRPRRGAGPCAAHDRDRAAV